MCRYGYAGGSWGCSCSLVSFWNASTTHAGTAAPQQTVRLAQCIRASLQDNACLSRLIAIQNNSQLNRSVRNPLRALRTWFPCLGIGCNGYNTAAAALFVLQKASTDWVGLHRGQESRTYQADHPPQLHLFLFFSLRQAPRHMAYLVCGLRGHQDSPCDLPSCLHPSRRILGRCLNLNGELRSTATLAPAIDLVTLAEPSISIGISTGVRRKARDGRRI